MRSYSQISPTWWTGTTGRAMTRRALSERDDVYTAALEVRIVGDWLMTGSQHNQYGLYYAPLVLIQAETGVRPSRMGAALTTLAELGFATYDELTSFVWVREMAAWQFALPLEREGKNGRHDNRIEAARRWYRDVPENPFLGEFFDRYARDFWLIERREMEGLRGGSEGPLEAPVPSPSPDLGTSEGRERERGEPIPAGSARLAALEVVAIWNRVAREPFSRIADEPASLGRVIAAVRRQPDLDWWERLFVDHVFTSRYLAGDNQRAWVADFWWLLEKTDEVMAGRYRDRQAVVLASKTQQRAASNANSSALVKASLRAER